MIFDDSSVKVGNLSYFSEKVMPCFKKLSTSKLRNAILKQKQILRAR